MSVKYNGCKAEMVFLHRGVFAQENASSSFSTKVVTNPFSFEEDILEIVESLNDIQLNIDQFTGIIGDNAHKRISSRLTHLVGRVDKLHCESQSESERKLDLQTKILELEDQCETSQGVANRTFPQSLDRSK